MIKNLYTFLFSFFLFNLLNVNYTQAQTVITFNNQGFTDGDYGSAIYQEGNIKITYFNNPGTNLYKDTDDGSSSSAGLYVAAYSGSTETLTIETVDGTQLDFQSFYIHDYVGLPLAKIEGFRDGSSTGEQTTGFVPGNGVGVISLTNSVFDNVDKVVITSPSSGFSEIFDDFTFGTAVTSSTSNIYWNLTTATVTSGVPANLTVTDIAQGNNNGTTTLIATGSVSNYTDASGGNYAQAAVKTTNGFNASTSTYFQTTLTPGLSNNAVSISNISFGVRSTFAGPSAIAVYSSVDNYSTPLAQFGVAQNNTWSKLSSAISATGAGGGAVSLRIYAYSGSTPSGLNIPNLMFDDLNITASLIEIPTITSATYNASSGLLAVTGTSFQAKTGALNDVAVSKLTVTGEGGATYTLTSSDVEITSGTAFSVTLNATDVAGINTILNKNGSSSTGGTTYNIAAASNWMANVAGVADQTGNGVTVSNVAVPAITSATYNANTGALVVTGTNFLSASGATNDIVANKFTVTAEGGATYTLTDTGNGEITSGTAFTLTLSATDKTSINKIINKNGTSSTGGTTYNLAAAEDWAAGADAAVGVADATGNGITASNVAVPAITSATYNANTGALVVTGTNFLSASGATNDIVANKFTVTAEGGATYTLTDTGNGEITSGTSFTLTLSATDKAEVNLLINKNGTASTGGSTYNLAAAEDWNAGADAAVTIVDASGNGVTASNVAVPTITSATYNANTGALVVTGTGLLSASGSSNDIIANKFTLTAEGGATYTLTDSANPEITSGTVFTLTLSATDKAAVNLLINKNGTSSTGGTTYNLAAAEDWAAGADAAAVVADATGNGITASNVATPAITSATYNANTGALVVTGTGFLSASGATNDIVANKFTIKGEGGSTYTLTDTGNGEISSGTSFTLTLSATDKAGVNLLINKNGTSSTGGTTYNLAAAEDWNAGADAAVTIVDATGNGITASNVNTAPTDLALSAGSINENVAGNSTIGTLSSTDSDAANTFTYTLVSGSGDTDNASFNISGSSLRVTNSPNYEAKSSYSVRVRTTDQGGLWYEEVFTIGINNVNESPTDMALSASAINENVAGNSIVGTLSSTDVDASNTFTYTLVTGTGDDDNASFNINGSDLRITNSPDFESKSSYKVRVRTTDQGSLTYEEAFTITINDLDDTGPAITSVSVPSNATYTEGQNLDFTVNFDENVIVNTAGGTPQLNSTIGSSSKAATYLSGSGTSALVFRYTVSNGDFDSNGLTISTLSLNGGTLKDAGGNNATLTLSSVGSLTGVLVDAAAPTVTSVNVPINGTKKVGDLLNFTVNFTENVTVTGTPKLAVTIGTTAVDAPYTLGSGGQSLVFRYTVASGDLDTDGVAVGTLSLNSGTIKDAAGNNATLTLNSVGSTVSVLVDAVTPTLSSVSVASNNGTTTLAKTGDQVTVTFTASEEIASPTATIAGQTATISNSSGNTYTAKYTMTSSAAEGTIPFNISFTDLAGNTGTAVTATTDASSVIFDKTAPATPANLAATSGNTQNALSWTANAEGDLKGYKIYGGTTANPTTLLNTANASATTYTHTGLTNGTTYYYRISAFDNAGNESTVSADITGVPRAPQAITFNTLNAKSYGAADFDAGATATSGLTIDYASDNLAVATIVSGKIHIVGAGTATITASQTGDNAYLAAADKTQTLTVNKKDITVALNATPAITKIYNGTASATLVNSNYTLSGVESADAGNVSVTGTASYDTDAAGNGKTVTATSFVLSGAKKDNYNLTSTSASTTGTITKRGITITLNATPAITKEYDGTATATLVAANYNFPGIISGDEGQLGVNSTATYDDAGASSLTVVTATNFVLTGAKKDNYTLVSTPSATTTGTITKKPVTVTLTGTVEKFYGGDALAYPDASNYSVSGLLGTDVVTVQAGSATYDTKLPGTGKLVTASGLNLIGGNSASYSLSSTTASGNVGVITKKQLQVTLNASPLITKVYDGNTTATLAAANYTLSGVITGETVTVSGTATYDTRTAGTNKVITATNFVLAGADKDNYNLVTTMYPILGEVTKKTLTVTADNKSRFQGLANPAFSVSYSGFINGETLAALTVQPTASTTATTSSPIGTYNITPSGGLAANYSFSYVNGTLTVLPGQPTGLSLAAQTVYENAAAATVAGTLSSTSDDPNATFTYSLVAGAGDADNASFSISGNQLRTAAPLNFEQKADYKVRVRSTTQHGLSLDKGFTITISDVNEQPTLADMPGQIICYTSAEQSVAISGITAGPEAGQTTTTSVSTTNNPMFESLEVTQANAQGNASVKYKLAKGAFGSAVINIMVMDNGGTANSGVNTILKSFILQVNQLPEISITSEKGNELSKGAVTVLKANVTGGSNGLSYSWSSANGILSGQNTQNLTVRPSENTTYTLTVTNSNGCSTVQQISIAVNADYELVAGTNILSPNGDGKNDNLVIRNLDMYPDNELKIFDRAGRLLYGKKNYNNEWNGTFNGLPLAEGTYYYIIDFGRGIPPKKGFVSIVRD